MENFRSMLCIFVVVVLLLGQANAENRTDPRRNNNLNPLQQLRSVYFCMICNVSKTCAAKDTLAGSGILSVPDTEIKDFCWGGCAQHTLDVLTCIHDCNRNFYFTNNATVQNVTDAITNACSSYTSLNTGGPYHKNTARRLMPSDLYTPLASVLQMSALLYIFSA